MVEGCTCDIVDDLGSSDTSCLECGNFIDVGALEILFSKMLAHPKSCDIEFIVEGERFPAHRAVISAVSAPFDKMLMGAMSESTSKEIHMREISKNCWRLVLKYIYTGRVLFETVEDALGVARFAYMYEMKGLSRLVERYLIEHFPDIYQEDGYKLLPYEVIDRLTSNENLKVVSELDVLKSILAWAGLSDFHEDQINLETKEINEVSKFEDVRGLLLNVNVDEMEPWEIEMAWNFNFLRYCPKTTDAITKRLLSLARKRKEDFGIKPFGSRRTYRHQLPLSGRRFTFFFQIKKEDTPTGSWDCDEKINSPWMTDENTGRKWRLYVFLKAPTNRKHMSLFLELNSESDPISGQEKCQIFLYNNNITEDPLYSSLDGVQFGKERAWGRRRFVSIDSVFKDGSKYLTAAPATLTFGASIFHDE